MNFEEVLNNMRGIMSVLNNWYHYAYLHLNGANQQRYNPSVISNYRNSLKKYISGINDEGIKGELLEYLGPLLSVKRNDFEGTISEIEKTVNPINSLYCELKSQQGEATNESRIKRIVSESVKKVIKEAELPILHGEGNGEVYRDDAFVTDWRDNPNNDPNKIKAPYNSYVWNRNFSEHYPTPESFWNPKDTRAYKYTKDLDKIHKEEDDFKKSEDIKTQRALDAADKRPLHRKGSLNRAFESRVRDIIKEAIDDMINSEGQISKPLLKIKAKVEEVAQMVNGNECVDTSSTWQIPYVPNYTVQEYRGNALRVVRTEQENSYYNNGGRKITSASKKQVWIITDKNYKEKWNGDYYDEGLKHYLARDKKGFNAYNK